MLPPGHVRHVLGRPLQQQAKLQRATLEIMDHVLDVAEELLEVLTDVKIKGLVSYRFYR